jgi:pyridine nucleotide-disulfide oxidoreductase family protein
MRRLVLVGGGHAHLAVLKVLAVRRPADLDVTLITPSPLQTYSGRLPGWMAGHYELKAFHIDLRPMAAAAGVTLVLETVGGMDADRRCVALSDSRHIDYDLLSLDIGSETDLSWLEAAGERVLAVRPIDTFVAGWNAIRAQAGQQSNYQIAVVGGGAAGVELALAAKYRLNQDGVRASVTLVTAESELLPGHARGVVRRIERQLAYHGVLLHHGRAAGLAGGLMFADGIRLTPDAIIAATGARPACWLRLSKLALDENGYIAVSADHRSVSHGNVFAAGDTCSRVDMPLLRSGVHAVRAGPVLAHNLLATLNGEAVKSYRPRRHTLYILATGPKYAVASWGPWSAEGAWVWCWKDGIDRRFIARQSIANQKALP